MKYLVSSTETMFYEKWTWSHRECWVERTFHGLPGPYVSLARGSRQPGRRTFSPGYHMTEIWLQATMRRPLLDQTSWSQNLMKIDCLKIQRLISIFNIDFFFLKIFYNQILSIRQWKIESTWKINKKNCWRQTDLIKIWLS